MSILLGNTQRQRKDLKNGIIVLEELIEPPFAKCTVARNADCSSRSLTTAPAVRGRTVFSILALEVSPDEELYLPFMQKT
jgi:hypothetical protein